MGDALGRAIKKLHEEHGVTFHLGSRPVAIDPGDVTLDGGAKVAADLVVVGIGVRPALGLAAAAGLTVDRGVVVDENLKTSAPNVFAAGDIARWPVAALNMLGARERFDGVPFFWSAHYDVTIAYVGHAETWDRVDVAGSIEGRDCAVAFRRGRRTLAVATIGRDKASLDAEAAMERADEDALHAIVP
jgi:NADPH-dependent 2,4-dienoyl-CoA reductase/sulfur reductase-like enzyme